jgi:hypothetical protein
MNESGKSDKPVVPAKPAKLDFWEFCQEFFEPAEGRGLAKENEEGPALLPVGPAKQVDRTQSRLGAGAARCEDLHSALDRVRQAALEDKGLRFTSLWHHVYDIGRLREAYFALKRTAAPGVDGQTWQAYGQDLESNLKDLSDRLARGAYRAKPVKRAFVPKAGGKQRPIGVPTLEDKIVQRATVEVLNAVYETDFLGFSYGFRPGRSAHEALDALAVGIQTRKVSWLLDADIRSFFDTLDHGCLLKFIERRIADAGGGGARSLPLLRRSPQLPGAGSIPRPGPAALATNAHASQPEGVHQRSADDPNRLRLATHAVHLSALSRGPPGRHDPRQEPGAVNPPAGICAGGGGQPPSLPRRIFVSNANTIPGDDRVSVQH